MTKQQEVLTKILKCGTCDLSLLDDIEYDLDDIIDDCIDDDDLSLHGIFKRVFYLGADKLQEAFDERKDEIKESILQEIANEISEYVDTGEMTQEELEECEEHQELVSDLELLNSNELSPSDDVSFYLNCLDTHVMMKHIGFYRRWLEKEVFDIESNMGWHFEEGCY